MGDVKDTDETGLGEACKREWTGLDNVEDAPEDDVEGSRAPCGGDSGDAAGEEASEAGAADKVVDNRGGGSGAEDELPQDGLVSSVQE